MTCDEVSAGQEAALATRPATAPNAERLRALQAQEEPVECRMTERPGARPSPSCRRSRRPIVLFTTATSCTSTALERRQHRARSCCTTRGEAQPPPLTTPEPQQARAPPSYDRLLASPRNPPVPDALGAAQIGDTLRLEGEVGQQHPIRGTAGFRAVLTIEGHGAVPCVWWDGAGASATGQTVVLVGVVKEFKGTKELHVDRTMPSGGADPIEGRLLRYWTNCIEAEAVSRLVLPADGSNYLLIDAGAEPAITAPSLERRALPADDRIHEWCARRQRADG